MADSTLNNSVLDAVSADVQATLTGFAASDNFGAAFDGAALQGTRQ